jgi:hypothetical protein
MQQQMTLIIIIMLPIKQMTLSKQSTNLHHVHLPAACCMLQNESNPHPIIADRRTAYKAALLPAHTTLQQLLTLASPALALGPCNV